MLAVIFMGKPTGTAALIFFINNFQLLQREGFVPTSPETPKTLQNNAAIFFSRKFSK